MASAPLLARPGRWARVRLLRSLTPGVPEIAVCPTDGVGFRALLDQLEFPELAFLAVDLIRGVLRTTARCVLRSGRPDLAPLQLFSLDFLEPRGKPEEVVRAEGLGKEFGLGYVRAGTG